MKVTSKVCTLLAYLLLQRHRSHHREVLAGLFWGEYPQDKARSCLSTALWRLRGILEPEGISRGTYLVITPAEVSFNQESDHWLDVALFEAQLSRVLTLPPDVMEIADAQELKAALQLYTGELLEGFYDDWVLRERERLRLLYLNSLLRLMAYYKHRGAYKEGLACGQQILQHDPLREDIHREVMCLYLRSGQRALAVQQYEICRKLLSVELDIPPMPETQTLYEQIVPGAGHSQRPDTLGGDPASIWSALQQLRLAVQCFDKMRAHLERSIQLIEHLTESER